MLISTHVLVGSLVGRALARPLRDGTETSSKRLAVAGVVGLVSHFGCDMLPHWGMGRASGCRDPEFLKVAIPDGLVGLGLMVTVVSRAPRHARALVFAGALGACLPDADKVGSFALGRSPYPRAVDDWHGRIQREDTWRLRSDVAKVVALAAVVLTR